MLHSRTIFVKRRIFQSIPTFKLEHFATNNPQFVQARTGIGGCIAAR